MEKKKAMAAGHICIDITPVFPEGTRKVHALQELLKPGSLIHMSAPVIHTGGSAANTGLGMKKLGADVKLVGKVGTDAFGRMIQGILSSFGAGEDLIMDEAGTSSYTVVLAAPGVDRLFLHCPGANETFDGQEITQEALSDIALFPTIITRTTLPERLMWVSF